MEVSQEYLDRLTRALAALCRELEVERSTVSSAHQRILNLQTRCLTLQREIDLARKALAEAPAAEKAVEPEVAEAADVVFEARGRHEDIGLAEAKVGEPPPEAPVAEEAVAAAKAAAESFPAPPADEAWEPAPGEPAWEGPLEEAAEPAAGEAERTPVAGEEQAPSGDLETAIGTYWFSRIGAISLLVGFVIFAKWVNKYMTPEIRVAVSYGTAIALFAVGWWYDRIYPKFARPVMAAGLVLAFFTSFASYFIGAMHCFSQFTATVLMILTAGIVIAVAARLRSQAMALMAQGMGIWVAVCATTLADAFTPSMLVFLCVIGATLFIGFRWLPLMVLSVLGIYFCHAWWIFVGVQDWPQEPRFWLHLCFLTIYFGAFVAGDIIARLQKQTTRDDAEEEALVSLLPKLRYEDLCITIQRFFNPIAFFLIGTFVFFWTQVYWAEIHYFYWALGVVLAAVAFAFRYIERKPLLTDDVYYVLSTGLITLGFANAFDSMRLSNVLALEGLCLFALHRMTGNPLFSLLSVIHYGFAFVHFNVITFGRVASPEVSDWGAFGSGLPAVLFTLAPIFLVSRWTTREAVDETGRSIFQSFRITGIQELDEGVACHVRALVGSLLLLRLFAESVRPEVIFGIWVMLVPAALAAAWLLRRDPGLWTLAASFLAWAHLYFFTQLRKVESGDPTWMLPAAILLTLLALGIGLVAERLTKGRIYEPEREETTGDTCLAWATAFLVGFSVADLAALVELRVDVLIRYPLAAALAVAFIASAVYARMAFPLLAGLLLLAVESLFLLKSCSEGAAVSLAGLFLWTLAGVTLAVISARVFEVRAKALLRDAFDQLSYGSHAAIGATILVILALPYSSVQYAGQYTALGFVALTAMTLFALVPGLLAERLLERDLYEWEQYRIEAVGFWVGLMGALVVLFVVHVNVLLDQRVAAFLQYPSACVIAVGLMGFAIVSRMLFPCMVGLTLLVANSVVFLGRCNSEDGAYFEGFFWWTLIAAACVFLFERLFRGWFEWLLRRGFDHVRLVSIALAALLTCVLVALVHVTPSLAGEYETVGFTVTAIVLFTLGFILRTSIYRRFGLAVFALALARVYVIDLRELQTEYKIVAFMALGAVMIAVGYLYNRYKEQFQKWV